MPATETAHSDPFSFSARLMQCIFFVRRVRSSQVIVLYYRSLPKRLQLKMLIKQIKSLLIIRVR